MKGVVIPLRSKTLALTLAFVLFALVLAQDTAALAQELPPFPILYGGRALVDGEPVAEETRLVARVGDYETWTTVEKDGAYRNLLVSPPSREYFYVPVTFHAMGLTADEQDVFLPAGAPIFKDVGFDLRFSRPSDGFFQLWMAVAAGVMLVVLAGWFGLRKRYGRGQDDG